MEWPVRLWCNKLWNKGVLLAHPGIFLFLVLNGYGKCVIPSACAGDLWREEIFCSVEWEMEFKLINTNWEPSHPTSGTFNKKKCKNPHRGYTSVHCQGRKWELGAYVFSYGATRWNSGHYQCEQHQFFLFTIWISYSEFWLLFIVLLILAQSDRVWPCVLGSIWFLSSGEDVGQKIIGIHHPNSCWGCRLLLPCVLWTRTFSKSSCCMFSGNELINPMKTCTSWKLHIFVYASS